MMMKRKNKKENKERSIMPICKNKKPPTQPGILNPTQPGGWGQGLGVAKAAVHTPHRAVEARQEQISHLCSLGVCRCSFPRIRRGFNSLLETGCVPLGPETSNLKAKAQSRTRLMLKRVRVYGFGVEASGVRVEI